MSVVLSSAAAACILLMICTVGCQRFSLPAPPTSFVLIVADTLRRDHLGLYGYERDTSPRLDAWSTRGSVFDRAFSTSPWTLPTFGTLFTGLLPSSHGAGYGGERHRMDAGLQTLAETLRESGRATAAFVSNPYLTEDFGVIRGFQMYANGFSRSTETGYPREGPGYRNARVATDQALAWLDEYAATDFFLVVHYFDAHAPLRPPPPFRGRFTADYKGFLRFPLTYSRVNRKREKLSGADREFLAGVYDEEIAFVDDQVGRLLDGLKDRGIFDRSLVVFTADHGEELLERGVYDHGHTLFNEMLRVPLMIWGPGVVPARHAAAVSLIDVMPTALDALGLSVPAELQGISLWGLVTGTAPAAPDRTLFAEATTKSFDRAVIKGSRKAIVPADGGPIQVYDWVVDPTETTNLVETAEASAVAFAAEARAVLPRPRDPSLFEPVELLPEVRDGLKALGYLE